eukprot:1179754-Pleurochrysis_carterae.AAC.1
MASSSSVEDRINLHQLMELKAAFERADLDNGGSLDMEEFLEAFGGVLGKNLAKKQLMHLFMKVHRTDARGKASTRTRHASCSTLLHHSILSHVQQHHSTSVYTLLHTCTPLFTLLHFSCPFARAYTRLFPPPSLWAPLRAAVARARRCGSAPTAARVARIRRKKQADSSLAEAPSPK